MCIVPITFQLYIKIYPLRKSKHFSFQMLKIDLNTSSERSKQVIFRKGHFDISTHGSHNNDILYLITSINLSELLWSIYMAIDNT